VSDDAARPVPGIAVEAVTDWLEAHVDGLTPPFSFELLAGGRSNLTSRVTDGRGRRVVLRRPPLSHVLSSAHDMAREHRIISALHDTVVPVPTALGLCTDDAVNGAPFYVMDFVEGSILRSPATAEARFDEAQRATIGFDLVDVLADLHAVDIDAVGLGDLARRDGYVARQLKRWNGQFEKSQAQQAEVGLELPEYGIGEMHERLADCIPAQRDASIVHADYRLDNAMIGDDARVAAVLDWELCTLGDPLADLGTLVVYWHDADQHDAATSAFSVTALPGFPTGSELVDRYATRSGRDVSTLAFFVAFANWRLACILDGVRARHAAGAMGEEGREHAAGLGTMVMATAARARAALDSL
jgi:aminoglycoside phosphotransferase (APT) family kinase protein